MLRKHGQDRRGSRRGRRATGMGRREGGKALTLIRFERIQDESSHCLLKRKEPKQLMLCSD